MWPVHGVHVPTLWKSGSLNFLEPSGSVQGLSYLLSHISGHKLTKHPTLQLLGFSCIVLADHAVTVFAVKEIEGVLLTVHLSIILVINQHNAQNLVL